ncbi:MAG TPA: hypothetical protein VN253_26450 [Kofleriaceae bacterium]|nr:hypothetical protein [Kofleriaceae bacterium]
MANHDDKSNNTEFNLIIVVPQPDQGPRYYKADQTILERCQPLDPGSNEVTEWAQFVERDVSMAHRPDSDMSLFGTYLVNMAAFRAKAPK